MDFAARDILFNRIITGLTIIKEKDHEYLVRDPYPFDILIAQNYYQTIYNKLLLDGVPSELELMAMLIEKKLWSQDDENKIKDLQGNLKKLKKQLPGLEFKSNEKRQVELYIDHTKAEIIKLQNIKTTLLQSSAEYLARLDMYKKHIFRLTFNMDEKRIWENWEAFMKDDDRLINRLINKAFFNPDIDAACIRDLARNEPWRSIWVGANKVGNLFPKSMSQLTTYQRLLVSWSIIYDSAYESPDCPAQVIINDDDLFDDWLEQQADKRRGESMDDSFLSEKARNAQEVGIMVDTEEDARRVYRLNNPMSISKISSREKVIKEKGSVYEAALPDRQMELKLMINKQASDKIMKGSQ